MSQLPPDLLKECVELLSPLMGTVSQRQTRLDLTVGRLPIFDDMNFEVPTQAFITDLVSRLTDYGRLSNGTLALCQLLQIVSEEFGTDHRARFERLIERINTLQANAATPPAEHPNPFPPASIGSGAPLNIRIFLSSPGDVADERNLAHKVIDQFAYAPQYRGKLIIEVIAWDKKGAGVPMLATMTPQEAINQGLPKPSECDIVIVIFWARMGTLLPPEYLKADGSRYLSGTEWEYEDAVNAARQSREQPARPQVVVYWRTEKKLLDDEAADFEHQRAQKKHVKEFFDRFTNADGSIQQGYNKYETSAAFGELLEVHLKSLLDRLLAAPRQSGRTVQQAEKLPALWSGSPFPGLRAFMPDDAPIYFGRGRETDELIARLTDPASRFVCVVGASGSGKSSLVGAGLLPRLAGNALTGSKDWLWADFTPGGAGDNPFMALASSLIGRSPAEKRRYPQPRALADDLQHNPPKFDEMIAVMLAGRPAWAELLLFIDQFEELFTQVDKRYRGPFIDLLDLLATTPHVRIVATLRADFYHRCVEIPKLAALLNGGTYNLPAPETLYEMIVRPADRAGLWFEEGLPERILHDTTSDPGALPLMAYTLDELYQRCQQEKSTVLTTHAYEDLGKVQGAIGKRATNIFKSLDDETQAALPIVFRELVEVDERGVATRQRATLKQITGDDENSAPARLVDALVKARLLVLGVGVDNQPTVEVAHEAVLRSWPDLAHWIRTHQEDLILLRQVNNAASEWARRGRDPAFRWQHEHLKLVYDMLERLQPKLDEVTRDFIRPVTELRLDEINLIDTSHERRNEIGPELAKIGDPRPGVGLRKDGKPHIAWLPVGEGDVEIEGLGQWHVQPFFIAKYLVTYRQFDAFVQDKGYETDQWWHGLYTRFVQPPEQVTRYANYPRDAILWPHVAAFCNWLNAKCAEDASLLPEGITIGSQWQVRLPTEWEWQFAATGGDANNTYPWGPDWDPRRANTVDSSLAITTAVGMYPHGAAPCGALDMSGNICEWCYNGYDDINRVDIGGDFARVRRGGSCNHGKNIVTTKYRFGPKDDYRNFNHDRGFRVVVAPPIKA